MNVGGIMFDLSDQQGGFEAPPDGLEQKTCPRCGSETVASFGLMGGGYGPYVICDGEPACGWYFKRQLDEVAREVVAEADDGMDVAE